MDVRRVALSLSLLIGCGDDGAGALPDAPPFDAPADVALGGPVTVTVWSRGARDPEATVLFQTASGDTVSRVTTDRSGTASGDVPTGGMITVAQATTLSTIVEVAGGDEIAVGDDVAVTRAAATVTLPPGPTTTTSHIVLAPCASGSGPGPTIALVVFASCPRPTPVLGIARAGATDQAYLVDATTIGDGTASTLAASWGPPAQLSTTVHDLPASVTRVSAALGPRVGAWTVYAPTRGLPVPANGATSATLPVPPPYGDGTELRYIVGRDSTSSQLLSRTVAGAPSTDDLDGRRLLPWVESTQASMQGVTWTQSSGDPYDGAIVTLNFSYKGATFLTWRAVLPTSSRQFVMPTLPADIAAAFAQAEGVTARVELVDSDAFDHAGMRARGATSSFRRDEALPVIRTLRVSSR